MTNDYCISLRPIIFIDCLAVIAYSMSLNNAEIYVHAETDAQRLGLANKMYTRALNYFKQKLDKDALNYF